MSAIEKILCPVDFSKCSERALDQALQLANQLDAALYLLHAYVDPLDAIPFAKDGTAGPPSADPGLVARAKKQRAAEIQRLRTMCAEHGVGPQAQELPGDPRTVIPNYAASLKANLIVMGTHGHSLALKILMGSVTERVVRANVCPVMLVQ